MDREASKPAAPADPLAPMRTRGYAVLLLFAAVLGVPIAAGSYGFLQLTEHLQQWVFTSMPDALGFRGEPVWWPLPVLGVCGLLVALTIRYLPGNAGHEPAEGLKTGGAFSAPELPSILIAAILSVGLGPVIGPEAPLIALGGGVSALAVRALKRDADSDTIAVAGATGSFAAISALLGSPLTGAFLLMEASGLGGARLEIALLPGLLAAGIGALIFIGLGSWTGLGSVSLGIANPPRATNPTAAEFGWALVIGVACALAGVVIRRCAMALQRHVRRNRLWLTPALGLGVAGLAIAFLEGSGWPSNQVLFSGQSALSPLVGASARYSVGALLLLMACKGLAYVFSLSAFRGGPVFPSLFIGAAGGIAFSHAPGLPLASALGMAIGGMAASMLGLPLTAVLLATLLLGHGGVTVMPLVIVTVVVSHILSIRLIDHRWGVRPRPAGGAEPAGRRQTAG